METEYTQKKKICSFSVDFHVNSESFMSSILFNYIEINAEITNEKQIDHSLNYEPNLSTKFALKIDKVNI